MRVILKLQGVPHIVSAIGAVCFHEYVRQLTWAGCGPAQSPHRCTKCNSPPINGQCTNFILLDVALIITSVH